MHQSEHPSRLESSAFNALLVTAILAPLAFWPSQYFVLEAAKTLVISLGTLTAFVLYALLAIKERSLSLPPKQIVWAGALLIVSIIASSFGSGHFFKSFFGQGFELGAGSFIALLVVSLVVSFVAVSRRVDHAMIIYTGIAGSFFVLYAFQGLRLALGAGFASLGVLGTATSTILGNWYGLGIFSMTVAIIALTAVLILPLPPLFKRLYWVLFAAAIFGAIVINSQYVWQAAALVMLGLTLYLSAGREAGAGSVGWLRRIAWVPFFAFAIAAIFAWKGPSLAAPLVDKLGAGYAELSLPWQMTVDVAAAELKSAPLLGAGPNRFTQAFLAYKPVGINATDAWSVEFNSGFGLIPTFVVTQGILGAIAWAMFFIFFGLLAYKSLRGLVGRSAAVGENGGIIEPEQPYARFVVVSSFAAASFLWVVSMIYVLPHALFFLAFLMTGIALGSSAAYGRLQPLSISARDGGKAFRLVMIAMIVIAAIWMILFLKGAAALAYFGSGLRELTADGNPVAADSRFSMALALNPADVYWQGRVEASLGQAKALIATASSPGASSTAIAAQAGALVNQAFKYSQSAVAADQDNYYNFLSVARVAEAAASLRMDKAYETGVGAYGAAIRANPYNPSIYVNLARFQASNNKLDDALQTVGASLQVKNNYLDAVFLLSQIEAAKGNLPDAITAAQFAVKLNPNDPLLRFQLGLFQYTNAAYADAADTLALAVKLQPDYANAQYFLGLSYARLGRIAEAIAQFERLGATNTDNQEISAILTSLRAGRSLFSGAKPALTTAPEKRSALPVKEKIR